MLIVVIALIFYGFLELAIGAQSQILHTSSESTMSAQSRSDHDDSINDVLAVGILSNPSYSGQYSG